MADQITRANQSARNRAASAGRLIYQHEVVDAWPACVECGRPIRHPIGERTYERTCGCPGVRWRCGMDGWRRVETEEATS